MRLIGLDAASDWRNFGYAIGTYSSGSAIQIDATGLLGDRRGQAPQLTAIVEILKNADAVLIAIDAPLGWPSAHGHGHGLADHAAGAALAHTKLELFRRRTDDFVKQLTGKQPLEVGADRIARATHAALDVIEQLRRAAGKSIPPAWDREFRDAALIEVYPAATLRAHGVAVPRYSRPENWESRVQIAERLSTEVDGLGACARLSPHAFDACICLVAARDFLEGTAVAPPAEYSESAQKEGWIWVREPRVVGK
jgi:predicted nuclease with RNAse H fold